MDQILLNGINVDELLERIGKLIDSKLINQKLTTQSEDHLLSRADVSTLLKVSLPTLHDWTKQGWLQSYKIGNRVYYKLKEVEIALIKVSNNKHKKGL